MEQMKLGVTKKKEKQLPPVVLSNGHITEDGPVVAAMEMIDRAIEEHHGIAVYSLFSGGHDSLVATHVASHHPMFRGVIHIDTGTGLRETREFVEKTCEEQGWELIVIKAHLPFESYLVKLGFPGPGMHHYIYTRLKDRPLRYLLGQLKSEFGAGRKHHFILASGVRKDESDRRADIQDHPHVDKSIV